MDESSSPLVFYQILAGKLISVLNAQVLVLGIFVVFLGFLAQALNRNTSGNRNSFVKQILLFLGVTLFDAYIALVYFVEAEANFSFQQIGAWWVELADEKARHTARILTLTLFPIDLMVIGFTAFLFVIIWQVRLRRAMYRTDLVLEYPMAPQNQFSTPRALPLLFIATGSIHALFTLWWLVASLLGGEGRSSVGDITYHGAYALTHFFFARVFSSFNKIHEKHRRVSEILQYTGIIIYLALTVSVYVYRTYTYFERLELYHPDNPSAAAATLTVP